METGAAGDGHSGFVGTPLSRSLISDFQSSLGYRFNNLPLLETALIHRSLLNETRKHPELSHNERLEFLGDAVLGLAVADILYERLEGRPEGELARIKSAVVSEATLCEVANSLGIAEVLKLGRGEELSGGRQKPAILADALEAVIGAIFLDSGYGEARACVKRILDSSLARILTQGGRDYKTLLQEASQRIFRSVPLYTLDRIEGPEHRKTFWVSCTLGGERRGPFSGLTKKEAEQKAAQAAYESLSSNTISGL